MVVLCKTRGRIGKGVCPDVLVGGALCGMTGGTCAHEEIVEGPRCAKCGGLLKPSKAIAQTYTGMPDFIGGEVCTVSPGGSGKLVECMKCEKCGWSVTG